MAFYKGDFNVELVLFLKFATCKRNKDYVQ